MEVLDTSGLKCPLPVLKAKKALKTLAAGDRLTVIATDPGAMKDFHHFCEATGDTLESAIEADGVLTFVISKAR
jgi:tRNA 2-thiouridine synthesizing protein A